MEINISIHFQNWLFRIPGQVLIQGVVLLVDTGWCLGSSITRSFNRHCTSIPERDACDSLRSLFFCGQLLSVNGHGKWKSPFLIGDIHLQTVVFRLSC